MSALRSFKAFTNAAPVSPSILDDALGTVTRTLAFPCNLVNLDGYANGAGWFQIFDASTSPANGTVPLKALNVAAAGNLPSLVSSLGPITLNKGLFCAMSSTEATLTSIVTNYDVWGEVEEFEQQTSGSSVAGDLTTMIDSRQVWTDAAGPKTLLQVDLINGLGLVTFQGFNGPWLMIFAKDSPANGDTPIKSIPVAVSTSKQTFEFGEYKNGFSPFAQTAAYVVQDGCTLAISRTPGTLTLDGGNLNNIRAYYI